MPQSLSFYSCDHMEFVLLPWLQLCNLLCRLPRIDLPWVLRERTLVPGSAFSPFICSSYPFSSSYSLLIFSSAEDDLLPYYQYNCPWRLLRNSVLSDGCWCYYELNYPLFLPFIDSSCFPPLLLPPMRQNLVRLMSFFPLFWRCISRCLLIIRLLSF